MVTEMFYVIKGADIRTEKAWMLGSRPKRTNQDSGTGLTSPRFNRFSGELGKTYLSLKI